MADTLGWRIRIARMRRDITQKDLARLVGISRTAMNQIEHGDIVDPRSSHLCKIADALGVSMDYLAGRTDEEGEVMAAMPELV